MESFKEAPVLRSYPRNDFVGLLGPTFGLKRKNSPEGCNVQLELCATGPAPGGILQCLELLHYHPSPDLGYFENMKELVSFNMFKYPAF